MMLTLMLMFVSVAWAGEFKQVSEVPVGKYYSDGAYSIGSHENELVLGILFVPTIKGAGDPHHTTFMYVIDLDEGICICTERKDYDSKNKLYQEHRYDRLISVPIEEVDIIVNALKMINIKPIMKMDNDRFNFSNALTGIQYNNDWLKSFQILTKFTVDKLSYEEKQQVGNLGVEMQTLGFYNWSKTVEGTLRKQEYELCKLEYELALERKASGKVAAAEVAEKEKKYQKARRQLQEFLEKFHVAD